MYKYILAMMLVSETCMGAGLVNPSISGSGSSSGGSTNGIQQLNGQGTNTTLTGPSIQGGTIVGTTINSSSIANSGIQTANGSGSGLTNFTASGVYGGANLMPWSGVYTNNASAGFPTFGVHLTSGVIYNYYTDINCGGILSGDGQVQYPASFGGIGNTWSGYFTIPTNGNYVFYDVSGNAGDLFSSQLYVSNNLIIPTDLTVGGNLNLLVTLPQASGGTGTNSFIAALNIVSNYTVQFIRLNNTNNVRHIGFNVAGTLGSHVWTGTANSFTVGQGFPANSGGLVTGMGMYLLTTNGVLNNVSQYRIIRVLSPTSLETWETCNQSLTYSNFMTFIPTTLSTDNNGNMQGWLGQDSTVGFSGNTSDGTGNSGGLIFSEGTNSMGWSGYNDSVNNWIGLHSYFLGNFVDSVVRYSPQAPKDSQIISSNGVNTFTYGVLTLVSNTVAPTSLSFPLTTVNWTNPVAYNIEVYINNATVTGSAIKKNGATIFSSVTGDCTFNLQKGEYFSETYTVGSPTATWSPH